MDDIEYQNAWDGDRTSSLVLWREVAEGRFNPDVKAWLQKVAVRLLEADRHSDLKRRPDKIVQAVGLSGRIDVHRRAREVDDTLKDFGLTQSERVAWLDRGGLTTPDQFTEEMVRNWSRRRNKP